MLLDNRRRGGDPGYGWAVVAALAVTATVSYGVLTYTFAVLLVPMERSLGFSRPELTGAFSVAMAVSALAGLAVGPLLDRRSPRALMSLGSATAVLLVLAWSRVHSLVELYLVFAGLGLAMAAVLYEPAFIVITKWFHVRRREALTVLTLVGALASIIFSPLSEWLSASFGWRDALVVLALILAAINLPLHLFVVRAAPPAGEERQPEPSAPARAVLRSGPFWLLASSFVLGSFVWQAIVIHLVALLLEHGSSAAFAAFAAGLVGVSQIPGRLVFGLFGRQLRHWRLPAAVYGLGTLALGLLALDRSQPAVVAFALLFGTSGGMQTLLRANLIAELYGRASYGGVASVAAGCSNGARAVAPFAAAALALLPGHYTTLLWLLAGFAATAAVLGVAADRGARATPLVLAADAAR